MNSLKIISGLLICTLFAIGYKNKKSLTYSREDIMKEFSILHPNKTFVEFEHPYLSTAGSRLTLYGDETRWAMVFEKAGYSNSGFSGEIWLTYFGNCLINQDSWGRSVQYKSNSKFIPIISDKELEGLEQDYSSLVLKDKKQVKVRDTLLRIEHDISKYEAKGMNIRSDDNPENLVDFASLIRYLDEEHPQLFRAADKELRTCLPSDIPKIMCIDKWHHEEYTGYSNGPFYDEVAPTNFESYMGTSPLNYETYNMIAEVLISKDTTMWKPTLKPNNDWRNWPNAGHF